MNRLITKTDPQVVKDFEEIPAQFLIVELDEGTVAQIRHNKKPPHRHFYQEIIWVRQGSAEHLLDGDIIEFPAQTLLIIPKGRIHRFVPSVDCLGCAIRFKEEFLANPSHLLFSQFTGHTAMQLTQEQTAGIEAYFSLLRCEYKHADPYQLQALSHLLAAFIAKLEELRLLHSRMVPQDFTRTLCIWNRFNSLIEQKFKTEHAVSYYASELGLSSRKLGEVVKLYTGKYVSDVIDERQITEAKRLILFSTRTIKEIAFELGFEEHSYFSKVFKKLTGSSPSDFKNNSLSA
ncbi:MAG: helix-turn-helix transcriptional regulator [Desulfuromonadaceae bacterium]|nr:helix-turn-helix transcriptional regulator [Desulfuromonadaceae bacterium]